MSPPPPRRRVAVPLPVCALLARAASACLDATSLVQAGSARQRLSPHATAQPVFDPSSDNILVYTNPKTGSGTLQDSLGRTMSPKCWISSSNWTRATRQHSRPNAENFLKKMANGSHIWVVSASRNPFARDISEYFQGIHHRFDQDVVLNNMSVAELHADFRNSYYSNPSAPPQMWFKSHYLSLFGINVTAYPFDFDKKIMHFEDTFEGNKKLSILIIRVEDSDEWNDILRPFFPKVHIVKRNFAAGKWYGPVYRKFVETFQFKEHEVQKLLQSEMMHFYNAAEREEFKNLATWTKRVWDKHRGRSEEAISSGPPPDVVLC